MTTLYVALIQLAATLLARKIQADTLDEQARQKIVDDVEAQWTKVQAAHVALQTSEKK